MAIVLCDQRRALLKAEGNLLVRGGAGSGKTTIALSKACADLEANVLGEFGKVLFLSFARATVARVAEQATTSINISQRRRIEISTYHSFAWTVLKSHGYLLCKKPGVSILMPAQSRSRLAGLSGEDREKKQKELFLQEGLASFDLFPSLITQLFQSAPILAKGYAGAYPLIIVDEFQDTNSEEWTMIAELGKHSRLIALGDPNQRIYDFKGADPKRFDDFIAQFKPTEFSFKGENNRSAGTQIPEFAEDIIDGRFRQRAYIGVEITKYRGNSLRPLKQQILSTIRRLKKAPEWSLAILVPANVLAISIFDYMALNEHGLPSYPIDVQVATEGPMLASNLVALLLEPDHTEVELAALLLVGLSEFVLGRNENASATAIDSGNRYRAMAENVRKGGMGKLGNRGIAPGIKNLVSAAKALVLSGDPMSDWRTVRTLFDHSDRDELKLIGKEVRHIRLLHRGAQIEATLADAWRKHGAYRDARSLFSSAAVEDQFTATTRTNKGAVVMTIHKAKGKEFDEVIVYEGPHHRYLNRLTQEGVRSARFNLHVAVTRARTRANVMTPVAQPCQLLPE